MTAGGVVVVLVVPFELDEPRGNSTAALRVVRGLRAAGLGVVCDVVGAPGTPGANGAATGRTVVHAWNVARSGPRALDLARQHGWPLVLSFRGTDLDAMEGSDPASVQTREVLSAARVVTVLSEDQRARLGRLMPAPATPVLVVSQGVELPEVPCDRVKTRARLRIATTTALVVQVAGVRREKGFPQCLEVVAGARAQHGHLVYRLAGPVLDRALEAVLARWLADKPWAAWLGDLCHRDARELMAAADVTLHAGEREGQSNALLEAMAEGVGVVARDTAASRAVLQHEREGLLYESSQAGSQALLRFLADSDLRERCCAAARRVVATRFTPAAEVRGYMEAYRLALGIAAPPASRA